MRAAPRIGSSPPEAGVERCLRLLVVDDNPADASLITDSWAIVPGYTFQTTIEGTLTAALRALAAQRFDAVVLDSTLPDARGAESVCAVARAHPELPIIVVSGNDSPSVRREALHAGANAFIGKSESGTDLLGCYIVNAVERCQGRTKLWEQLVAAGPDAMLVTSLDGIVRFVNQAALELFDRPRADFLGQPVEFSVEPGATREIELARGNERRIAEIRAASIEWQGEPALLTSLRDQTERRRAEAALAVADRMLAMGTLAASMAHDVNSPLAAVMGNLEIALSELERERAVEQSNLIETLQDACEATRCVRDIIRDFRIFSRAHDEAASAVDVHDVIASTLRVARNEIRHRAELVSNLSPVPRVLANDSRLGQVLLNLIVNAAQAIPEGHASENRITVSTSQPTPELVEIAISDTGAGMSAATKARLFTPFFTTKGPDEGTGLGLSICDRIVRSFAGSIEVESELGQGSTFRVRLPVCDLAERSSARPPSRRSRPVTAARSRIFVIDDERKFAAIVERAFRADHDVRTFASAAEALRRLKRGDACDAIFCDLMMPEMMGSDFLAAVTEIRPALAPKVVFSTGGAFTPRARAFLNKSHNRVLEKPFSLETLRSTLESILC